MLRCMIPVTRCLQGLFVAGLTVFSTGSLAQAAKPVLYYIPHTHWEGAVFKTREEYPGGWPGAYSQSAAAAQTLPDYKSTLDQVAYFRPFLERYPEEAGAFRQFVAEGRLGIVGGMDVMPTWLSRAESVCAADALWVVVSPRAIGR